MVMTREKESVSAEGKEMTETEDSPGRWGADYIVSLEDMLCVELTPEQKFLAMLAFQAGWVKALEKELEDRK